MLLQILLPQVKSAYSYSEYIRMYVVATLPNKNEWWWEGLFCASVSLPMAALATHAAYLH